jgi:hypothetical protein
MDSFYANFIRLAVVTGYLQISVFAEWELILGSLPFYSAPGVLRVAPCTQDI